MTYLDELDEWEPFCGEVYPGSRPGTSIICTREVHDGTVPHLNVETGFQWRDHV